MTKTIVNQGAATPLALLEAFRLVTACEEEQITFEDACHILGAHGWSRLEAQKLDAWRNAVADSHKVEARAEFESVGVAPPSQHSDEPDRWQQSRRLVHSLARQKKGTAFPYTVARLLDSTSDVEALLLESSAAPTVLRELIDLRILGERSKDGVLEVRKPWKGAPEGVPAEWFFEKLSRYFLREWNDDDRDYRLLGYAYRAWLDKVEPDASGELSILEGAMDAALFIEFNKANLERLGIAMNPDKLRTWVRAVCQMGLCWIVSKGDSDGNGEFERPFPDPSRLIEWSLDDIMKPGTDVPLDEFIAKFGRVFPLLDYSAAEVLPFGVSFALRGLHDDGALELRFEGDARVKTRLSEDPAHRVPRANRVRRAR